MADTAPAECATPPVARRFLSRTQMFLAGSGVLLFAVYQLAWLFVCGLGLPILADPPWRDRLFDILLKYHEISPVLLLVSLPPAILFLWPGPPLPERRYGIAGRKLRILICVFVVLPSLCRLAGNLWWGNPLGYSWGECWRTIIVHAGYGSVLLMVTVLARGWFKAMLLIVTLVGALFLGSYLEVEMRNLRKLVFNDPFSTASGVIPQRKKNSATEPFRKNFMINEPPGFWALSAVFMIAGAAGSRILILQQRPWPAYLAMTIVAAGSGPIAHYVRTGIGLPHSDWTNAHYPDEGELAHSLPLDAKFQLRPAEDGGTCLDITVSTIPAGGHGLRLEILRERDSPASEFLRSRYPAASDHWIASPLPALRSPRDDSPDQFFAPPPIRVSFFPTSPPQRILLRARIVEHTLLSGPVSLESEFRTANSGVGVLCLPASGSGHPQMIIIPHIAPDQEERIYMFGMTPSGELFDSLEPALNRRDWDSQRLRSITPSAWQVPDPSFLVMERVIGTRVYEIRIPPGLFAPDEPPQ